MYGARPLKRVIQKEILNPLSVKILNGTCKENSLVRVNVQDGAITFEVEAKQKQEDNKADKTPVV